MPKKAKARRRDAVASKTDSNIDDEAAGRARAELAEESKRRQAAEAAELAKQNAEHQQKLEAAGPRTDDDIEDEEAGRRRKELAEESRQRQANEKAELAAANLEAARQLEGVGAAVDTDIEDEAAGARRRELAEESRARREAEAASLRARNAAMRERLKRVKSRTDDGDGGGDLGQAHWLLSEASLVPLERESSLTLSKYLMHRVNEENRQKGDEGRGERREHRSEREQHEGEWQARGASRVRERREREQHTRQVRQEMEEERRRHGAELREEEARWEAQRDAELAELHLSVAAKVAEAKSLDSRLDFAEALTEKAAHAEGAELKRSLSRAAEDIRTYGLSHRRQQVEGTQKARAALVAAKQGVGAATKLCAEEKRHVAKEWRATREQKEETYLSRARANRERAVAIREAARQSVQEMLQAKQRHATKERANDLLVTKAKVRVLESNRREVADRYRQRFVGHEEEQEWQSSPLRKLQQRFRGGFSSMSWVTDRSARDVEVAL